MTGCWAWLTRDRCRRGLVRYAETARNLVWVGLLYSLAARGEERQHGVSLVYGAVAGGIRPAARGRRLSLLVAQRFGRETAVLLRHHRGRRLAGAGPQSLWPGRAVEPFGIRFAMLGLALMWAYDLNLYTIPYLDAGAADLLDWRGAMVALTAPLFALGAATTTAGASACHGRRPSSRSRCSRSAPISR